MNRKTWYILGALLLAFVALYAATSDVVVDTMGFGDVAQTNIPYLDSAQYVQFDTSITCGDYAHTEGRTCWNPNEGTLDIMTSISGTTLQVGQELYTLVVNKTGSQLANGSVVYISGVQGNRPTVTLADADFITKTNSLGMITHDCDNNQECFMNSFGVVRSLNTSVYSAGDKIYLSQTAGEFTKTIPTAPAYMVEIGEVSVAHQQQGEVLFNHPGPSAAGDIYSGNYTAFESDGTMFATGDARAWIDFNFGVGALRLGATSPDLINLNGSNIRVFAFNGDSTSEMVDVSLEMNHDWAEGTAIEPHVHYMPTTTGTGAVVWWIEYCISALGGGAFCSSSTTISATHTITQASAWVPFYVDFSSIDMTGFTIGSQFHGRLYRDPSDSADTYGADAAVSTFGLHVQIDTLGSREEDSK